MPHPLCNVATISITPVLWPRCYISIFSKRLLEIQIYCITFLSFLFSFFLSRWLFLLIWFYICYCPAVSYRSFWDKKIWNEMKKYIFKKLLNISNMRAHLKSINLIDFYPVFIFYIDWFCTHYSYSSDPVSTSWIDLISTVSSFCTLSYKSVANSFQIEWWNLEENKRNVSQKLVFFCLSCSLFSLSNRQAEIRRDVLMK